MAYSSGLLSKSDVESSWLASHRTSGVHYWLETANSSNHYYVGAGGGVYNDYDSNSLGCFPAVWIY
jgi:hypothetical protein